MDQFDLAKLEAEIAQQPHCALGRQLGQLQQPAIHQPHHPGAAQEIQIGECHPDQINRQQSQCHYHQSGQYQQQWQRVAAQISQAFHSATIRLRVTRPE